MSQSPNDGEHLLASLLSEREAQNQPAEPTPPDAEDDVDAIIDELEALIGEGKRRLLGRKLVIDEDRIVNIVDRLRTAVPTEVRQAHRILDEHDRIIASAEAQARRMLDEQGMLEALEAEQQRILGKAEREADRVRADADRYVRGVLQELDERLQKLQTSVRNGIDALGGGQESAS
jgi:regulator of protease activity HflC (stomatin/prohibitin superfamily)